MLKVVGLGPGHPDYLAPAAQRALTEAEVIVGYKRYIGLLDPHLLTGKKVISTGMRGEMERCEAALAAALGGKKTVLVSSGDPGIYAMAGLVFEIMESGGLLDRIEVEIIPGLPALSAAAALLGAPLMHDFAVVSLSDLMTPWDRIRQRVVAALEADFVLVIYNPRSKKRRWQIREVLDLVTKYRGITAPVGIVRNAARNGQEARVVYSGDVNETVIDMLTIVVVGNSRTRIMGKRMVTPRGYMEKYGMTGGKDGLP
ncbi:MAG: precorrin-3B C(17)-methyltransferase [Deltaproteobacteria bacterium]|nr:precorrin-3B C(17)-methyltransferase [Deltaproteobacteria bacterium]